MLKKSNQLSVISNRWIPLLAAGCWLLATTSCEAPTTQRPTYTQAELQAEQKAQAEAVKAAQAAGGFNDKKKYTREEVTPLAARLSFIAERVEKSSEALCREMHGAQGKCEFEVVLDAGKTGLNAHADGQRVVVYPAMVDFAKNDNQLAFVIAHEFAHSIMNHIESQKKNVLVGGIIGMLGDIAATSQGIDTGGQFGELGASQGMLRYSPSFESEADYVGLYILARSDFNIDEAPGFWRMMSIAEPRAVYINSTHPNNPTRTIEMEKTVAEIKAKRQAKQPLHPNIAPRE